MQIRPTTDAWQPLGRQRYQLCDDVLLYEQQGSASPDEIRGLLQLLTAQAERYGYIIVLADSKHASPDAPETRKLITDWQRQHPVPNLTVVFGTTKLMRVAAMLLVRASQLLNKMTADMRFVAKEEEAWAVIAEQREPMQRLRKPGSWNNPPRVAS